MVGVSQVKEGAACQVERESGLCRNLEQRGFMGHLVPPRSKFGWLEQWLRGGSAERGSRGGKWGRVRPAPEGGLWERHSRLSHRRASRPCSRTSSTPGTPLAAATRAGLCSGHFPTLSRARLSDPPGRHSGCPETGQCTLDGASNHPGEVTALVLGATGRRGCSIHSICLRPSMQTEAVGWREKCVILAQSGKAAWVRRCVNWTEGLCRGR